MTNNEIDNTFEKEVSKALKNRQDGVDDCIANCVKWIARAFCFVIIIGMFFCAYLYGVYLLCNDNVSPHSIQTIERVTIFVVGGVTGFFVRLVNRSTGNNN